MNIKQIKEIMLNQSLNAAFEAVKKLHLSADSKRSFESIIMNYKKLRNDLMTSRIERKDETHETAVITANFLHFLDMIESELETTESKIDVPKSEEANKQKILFIYSCPKEKMQLDFGQEIKKIKKSLIESNLKQRDKFEIEVEEAVAADDLFRLIKNHNPNYIHIALHGSKSKGLLFQNNNGEEQPITTDELIDFFELITMKNPHIQCVVLSACHSAEPAKAIIKYVKYSIGSQAAIPDEAAIAFTRGFYEMIFDGEEVEYAFKAAKLAVKIAKIDSGIDDLPSHEIPVLYKQ